MSHPAIFEVLPFGTGYTQNLSYYDVRLKKQINTNQVLPTKPYGFFRRAALAASTVSPKNSFGWRDPRPYSGSKRLATVQLAQAAGTLNSGSYGWYAFTLANGTVAEPNVSIDPTIPVPLDALMAQCRQKALGKFMQMSVDLSVAFAERKKTANLVSSSCSKLAFMARDLRRGKLRGDDFAEGWLQYRYGWLPTMMDVHGAAETIAKADMHSYSRYRMTVMARKKAEYSSDTTDTENVGTVYAIPVARRNVVKSKAEASVRYDVTYNGAYRSLADVGVCNPATTIWELVPYSFCVDWFVGVGDFLEGLNATSGYSLIGGTETTFAQYKKTVSLGPKDSANWRVAGILGGSTDEFSRFNRVVVNQLPTSQLLLKEKPLNLTRMWDSIALLAGAFDEGKDTAPHRRKTRWLR